eukprot:10484746-Alexandrium_andersonii.AAC.1
MSASLVGSEMCIRDSTALSTARNQRKSEIPILQVQTQESPRFAWCNPVSYTHLTLPTICSV